MWQWESVGTVTLSYDAHWCDQIAWQSTRSRWSWWIVLVHAQARKGNFLIHQLYCSWNKLINVLSLGCPHPLHQQYQFLLWYINVWSTQSSRQAHKFCYYQGLPIIQHCRNNVHFHLSCVEARPLPCNGMLKITELFSIGGPTKNIKEKEMRQKRVMLANWTLNHYRIEKNIPNRSWTQKLKR